MASNRRQDEGLIQFTAAGTLASGEVFLMEDMVGVIQQAAVSGDLAVLDVQPGRIYEVPCKSTDVVAAGESLYWDDGNSEMTKTVTAHFCAGKAANASANGIAVVEIMLVNGNGVVGA